MVVARLRSEVACRCEHRNLNWLLSRPHCVTQLGNVGEGPVIFRAAYEHGHRSEKAVTEPSDLNELHAACLIREAMERLHGILG